MSILTSALGLWVAAMLWFQPSVRAQQQSPKLPQFSDYPVSTVYTGKPRPPRFVNCDQRYWRNRITEGCGKPNFAGRYTIVAWPCGSECMGLAIVDAATGTIYPPPFNNPKWPYALSGDPGDFQDPEYRVNSKLFVFRNACPEGIGKACFTYYLVWNDGKFAVAAKIPSTH